jgi:hypothetical protein
VTSLRCVRAALRCLRHPSEKWPSSPEPELYVWDKPPLPKNEPTEDETRTEEEAQALDAKQREALLTPGPWWGEWR